MSADQLGVDICRILGVDIKHVTRVQIDMQVAELPVVTITERVYDPDAWTGIVDKVSAYELRPK